MNFKLALIPILLALVACEPEVDKEAISPENRYREGEISTVNLLSIGDESTAGFHDNELFFTGQLNSFSSILSRGLVLFGSKPLRIPLMYDNFGLGNRLRLEYVTDCNDEQSLGLAPYPGKVDERNRTFLGSANFTQIAVPRLTVLALSSDGDDYTESNPYWARICPSDYEASVADFMLQNEVSFFTLWLGQNDVLNWAKSGGFNFQSPIPTAGFIFNRNYAALLDGLVEKGASGIVANLPDFTDFPFFSLIPRNALELNQEQAAQLNLIYAANPNVSFKAGPNNFVVRDGFNIRHIRESERILLSVDLDSVKCGGYGSVIPFDNPDVLLQDEISIIKSSLNEYNLIIDSLSANRNIPVVDMRGFYKSIAEKGVVWNGVETNFEFATGGFFSLDGIYPTQRGAALIANEFSKAIEEAYETRMPLANPNDFNGVVIP